MNKTRLISIMLLAMLLTSSCVAATIGGLQGKYDNPQPRTPQDEVQSWVCSIIFIVVIAMVALLARGGGTREVVFSIVGVAIGICFLLA